MVQNKGLIFKSVPNGVPIAGKDLAVEARNFDLEQSPPKGGLITKNIYASFDPYQRSRLRDPSHVSYSAPSKLGEPITSMTVARVLKSDNPEFAAGDMICAFLPIEEYSAATMQSMANLAYKIHNPYKLDLKLFLGSLGMPGLTAYSSLYEIGKPVKGETIFVSAASGAVGQMVGQLAKRAGLTVIGSVGSDDKLDFIIKTLGYDAGFNYKKEKPAEALSRLAPNGIDIYYENVGGEQLDAALMSLNLNGRIVVCGMVSQYSLTETERYGVKNLVLLGRKKLTMKSFVVVTDENMGPAYKTDFDDKVAKWIHDGSIKVQLSVTDGIDYSAEGFVGMLTGRNLGKAVLKIADIE